MPTSEATKDLADLQGKFQSLNRTRIADQMHGRGYALLPRVINPERCADLIEMYKIAEIFRKTISMERYRFGSGEYKYFRYPLPDLVQEIRESTYVILASIANHWMKVLRLEERFPPDFRDLQALCHDSGQTQPTPLMLKYGKGDFNTLHQDLYGDVYFPIQSAIFLSNPETEYQGGEFVMTQQTPRSQSKAVVLRPQKGDMLLFTTNFRPVKGKRGYYRAKMKHGVSEVLQGNRYTLGIIYHDALT